MRFGWWTLILALVLLAAPAFAVPLRILHTNDMHSHFREQTAPFPLGGLARLSTAIDRARQERSNVLLLDGGDWSEGNIYFRVDAGRNMVNLMSYLGYDAVVVGNHDFLNSADHLLNIFKDTKPSFSILAANLDLSQYSRAAELENWVKPYVIKKVGGIKIGILGLATYELIYDRWFRPVKITDPFGVARQLTQKLKREEGCDLVIVLSHNNLTTNKIIAGLPYVDLVVHSHDHVKITKPMEVVSAGPSGKMKTAYLVEAYQWGEFLGQLDLDVDLSSKTFKIKDYQLLQMDPNVDEDPIVLQKVDAYEESLTRSGTDFFHNSFGNIAVDLRREFREESPLLNFITDAYRGVTGADVAFEQTAFTAGYLPAGSVSSADLFNVLPFIYNPVTGRSWTLKTGLMSGETLSWVMNFLLSAQSFVERGIISISGMKVLYDRYSPSGGVKGSEFDAKVSRSIRSIEIGGAPVQKNKYYKVALPDGILEALAFLESKFHLKVEVKNLTDSNLEGWQVLAQHLQDNSPITMDKLPRGERIKVLQGDMALNYEDVLLTRHRNIIDGYIRVKNIGSSSSMARTLQIGYEKTPLNYVDDPNQDSEKISEVSVPPLAAGKDVKIPVFIVLPLELDALNVPVYFELNYSPDDPVRSNDNTWFMSKGIK